MKQIQLETHILPNGEEIKVQKKPASMANFYDKSTTHMGKDRATRRGRLAHIRTTATKGSK